MGWWWNTRLAEVGGDSPGEPPPTEEPRATTAQRAAQRSAKRTEIEVVEPVTDMFDEPDEIVLLFELPGVSRPQVRCLMDGDILLLEAKTDSRLFRKEVLIDAKLAGEPLKLRLRNGVLEVRLKKLT